MPYTRTWDSSCPQIYDEWKSDGASWVIQDLPLEDDEEALKLLVEHLIPDETMCQFSGIAEDPISIQQMSEFWRNCLSQRMSLACYQLKEGQRTLAALNCCFVKFADDNEEKPVEGEGEALKNIWATLKYFDSRLDAFKYLESDKLLYAVGLVVRTDFRGSNLGARVLAAREPLCKSQGIPSTSTLFTGIASQKSAARAGFTEVLSATLSELADAGLKYPRDDRCIKLMVKKYTL